MEARCFKLSIIHQSGILEHRQDAISVWRLNTVQQLLIQEQVPAKRQR
jgi:hypothetical protein